MKWTQRERKAVEGYVTHVRMLQADLWHAREDASGDAKAAVDANLIGAAMLGVDMMIDNRHNYVVSYHNTVEHYRKRGDAHGREMVTRFSGLKAKCERERDWHRALKAKMAKYGMPT